MKRENFWQVLFVGMGFFLGRIALSDMNPLAAAYYAALFPFGRVVPGSSGYRDSPFYSGRWRSRDAVSAMLGIFVGIATVSPVSACIRYGILMTVIGTLFYWMKIKENQRIKKGVTAGLVLFFISIGSLLLQKNTNLFLPGIMPNGTVFFYSLEAILTVTLTTVFSAGIAYLKNLKHKNGNEELTGFSLLVVFVIKGIPEFHTEWFSLSLFLGFFFLVYMGYRYGAGAGAMAGVFLGAVMSIPDLWEIENLRQIGIYAISGIAVGILREAGYFFSMSGFLLVQVLAELYTEKGFHTDVLCAAALSSILFLLLPGKFRPRINLQEEKGQVLLDGETLKERTSLRAGELSTAFQNLSRTFQGISEQKKELDRRDVTRILGDLNEQVCGTCPGYKRCRRKRTGMETEEAVLEAVKNQIQLTEEALPLPFMQECCNLEGYLEAANKELFAARINLLWQNRMAESREAVADQLFEVANIMEGFSRELKEAKEYPLEQEEQLKKTLRKKRIDLKEVSCLERKDKRREVYMRVRSRFGHCMTTKEVATLTGRILGQDYRLKEGNKSVISKDFQTINLVEDVNFKVLTGIARKTKAGEQVSGDNFSSLSMEKGLLLLSISDGMGSGEEACLGSESVLNLLEQFLEAGFGEEPAIRLINSVMVLRSEKEAFSTLDISLINLYTGICKFIKSGGAATYIRRERIVEKIASSTFPIGVWNQVEIDTVSKKLYDGDMVVMVSDGILEGIHERRKAKGEADLRIEESISREMDPQEVDFLEMELAQMKTQNPQEMADYILGLALTEGEEKARDDMTVMVAGIWKKR